MVTNHLPVGDQRYAELGGEVEGIAARQLVAAVKHGTEIGRVVLRTASERI